MSVVCAWQNNEWHKATRYISPFQVACHLSIYFLNKLLRQLPQKGKWKRKYLIMSPGICLKKHFCPTSHRITSLCPHLSFLLSLSLSVSVSLWLPSPSPMPSSPPLGKSLSEPMTFCLGIPSTLLAGGDTEPRFRTTTVAKCSLFS